MYAIDVRQTDRRQICIIALICASALWGRGHKIAQPHPTFLAPGLTPPFRAWPFAKKSYTHHWRHGRPMYVAVSICFNGFLLK